MNDYYKNTNIEPVTENTILMAFKSLTLFKAGRKPANNNLAIYNNYDKYFTSHYGPLINNNKITGLNLSSILGYAITECSTNINNNIKMHFIDHVRKFVNQSFRKEHSAIIQTFNGTTKERDLIKKTLKTELGVLKKDLFNGTTNSDAKYHK